jgi:hypothetical protein
VIRLLHHYQHNPTGIIRVKVKGEISKHSNISGLSDADTLKNEASNRVAKQNQISHV